MKKFLILIKEKDKTHEVASFQKQDNTILITFNGSEKVYSYSLNNCEIFDKPKLLSTHHVNDTIVCNAELIIQFGKYVKVFFDDGSNELFLANEDKEMSNKADIFGYCQRIAQKS
ncbi:hypothetical protein OLQ22_03660 [Campylobacter jejuni]|nr:hypothetical protein [Campylobacter jejuni]